MKFLEYVLAGLGVGVVFGLFGAGGSAFATPVLAVLGVPGLLAVASPLPAMLTVTEAVVPADVRVTQNGTEPTDTSLLYEAPLSPFVEKVKTSVQRPATVFATPVLLTVVKLKPQ